MKKLYLELFLLTLTLLASVLIIEKTFSNYKTPPDIVIRSFEEKKNDLNTVCIGNSHIIALGEIAVFEGKTFNLAFSGINMFDIAMLVRKLVVTGGNIKNVIIGLDYDILGLSSKRSILSLQLYRYTESLENRSLEEYIKAGSSYFRSGQDFWYLFAHSLKFSQKSQQNFIPLNFKSKDDKEACTRRALEHGAISYKEENIKKNIVLLNELIDFGRAYNLNLVFICTPKTSCYTSTYLAIPRIKAAKVSLDEIFKKKGMPYFDMTYERAFTDDDFIDFDHLNKSGAAKLIALLQTAIHHEE